MPAHTMGCFRLEERESPLGRFTAFVVSGNKAVLWEEVLLHSSMLLTGKNNNKTSLENGMDQVKIDQDLAFFATQKECAGILRAHGRLSPAF